MSSKQRAGTGHLQPPRGGDAQLREAIRRFRAIKAGSPASEGGAVPGCMYGVMLRDAIADLEADVEDLKAEVRWVRVTIVATIVTAAVGTVVKLAGW